MIIRKHKQYTLNGKTIYSYSQEPRGDVKPLDDSERNTYITSFFSERNKIYTLFSSSPLGIGAMDLETIQRLQAEEEILTFIEEAKE